MVLYWIESGADATIDDISLIAIIKHNNFSNSSSCNFGVSLVTCYAKTCSNTAVVHQQHDVFQKTPYKVQQWTHGNVVEFYFSLVLKLILINLELLGSSGI